jgi:chromosome segregation ATPase
VRLLQAALGERNRGLKRLGIDLDHASNDLSTSNERCRALAAEEQSAQRALETATARANHLETQSKELQSALQKQSACQPTVAKLYLDLAAAQTTINEQLGQLAQLQVCHAKLLQQILCLPL